MGINPSATDSGATVFIARGLALAYHSQYREAISQFRNAYWIDHASVEAAFLEGCALYAEGKHKEALGAWKHASHMSWYPTPESDDFTPMPVASAKEMLQKLSVDTSK